MVEFEELGIEGALIEEDDNQVKFLAVEISKGVALFIFDYGMLPTGIHYAYLDLKNGVSVQYLIENNRNLSPGLYTPLAQGEFKREDCHYVTVQSLILDGIKKYSKQEAP
jgi:hypothetical protein